MSLGCGRLLAKTRGEARRSAANATAPPRRRHLGGFIALFVYGRRLNVLCGGVWDESKKGEGGQQELCSFVRRCTTSGEAAGACGTRKGRLSKEGYWWAVPPRVRHRSLVLSVLVRPSPLRERLGRERVPREAKVYDEEQDEEGDVVELQRHRQQGKQAAEKLLCPRSSAAQQHMGVRGADGRTICTFGVYHVYFACPAGPAISYASP